MGHDVSVIVPNDYPDFLKWMKNDELIINYSNSKNESQEKIKNASLIFCFRTSIILIELMNLEITFQTLKQKRY